MNCMPYLNGKKTLAFPLNFYYTFIFRLVFYRVLFVYILMKKQIVFTLLETCF